MEKGKFTKVLKGVREIAHSIGQDEGAEKPEQAHLQHAIAEVREVDAENPEMAGERIEWFATLRDLRTAMSPSEWRLFDGVLHEHWDAIFNAAVAEATPRFERAEFVEENEAYARQIFSRVLRDVNRAMLNDPRLGAVFHGKKKKLEKLLRAHNATQLPIFERMLTEGERDDEE